MAESGKQAVREVRNVTWNFSGDVVLITGAAHGQGRSHALAFARAGADLALCDLPKPLESIAYSLGTPDELQAVAEECRALGASVVAHPCDVRDTGQVEAFVDAAVAELGKVDIGIANAGVASVIEVKNMTEQEWDELIDTNLKGVFLTFKHVSRAMRAADGGGSLIAAGSVGSFVGFTSNAHYSAAKHGVAGLCKALAIELAPDKIRVNYVCPTAVDTPMGGVVGDPRAPDGYPEWLAATNGSWNLLQEGQPPLQPEEITQAMMWLASDSSLYVTGIALPVDAGFLTK